MEHLKLYKKSQEKDRQAKPKMMTLEDTQKLIDQETRQRNNAESAGKGNSE